MHNAVYAAKEHFKVEVLKPAVPLGQSSFSNVDQIIHSLF